MNEPAKGEKTKRTVEYDVRTIDEYGDVQDVDSFHGRGSKRSALEAAQKIVSDGGTAVVERVIWTTDKDEDNVFDRQHERVWTGGDHCRLVAGHWREDGGAA